MGMKVVSLPLLLYIKKEEKKKNDDNKRCFSVSLSLYGRSSLYLHGCSRVSYLFPAHSFLYVFHLRKLNFRTWNHHLSICTANTSMPRAP